MSVHPIKPKAKKVAPAPAPLREEHLQTLLLVRHLGNVSALQRGSMEEALAVLALGLWQIFLRTPGSDEEVGHLHKHGLIAPHKGLIPWRLTAHGDHIMAQLPVPR